MADTTPKPFPAPQTVQRDGTSQSGRAQAALDPAYVSVDERSVADLLSFARDYARELGYVAADDGGLGDRGPAPGQPHGDWSQFLVPEVDAADVVAFMADPTRFDGQRARLLARPHFALFLTFLELLGHARDHLNGFTRRHLEFYFRDVLRMTRKPPVRDRVTVLFTPITGVEGVLVPEGSLLAAGQDRQGHDLVYRTERDLVVNRARVVRLSSIYIDKRITGIREARELHEGTRQEGVVRMFAMALGEPGPGDSLPEYTPDRGDAEASMAREVDYDLLLELAQLVDFAGTSLFMPLYDLRSMMQLKWQRDRADDEWAEINQFLESAARNRSGDPKFQLDPADPRDFHANLVAAIGGEPNYDGLPEVENIDDLYTHRIREDARAFIRDKLYFAAHDEFVRMMQIKVRIDNEWREVDQIVERAGQRKRNDAHFALDPADPADFSANLDAAVGPVDFSPLAGVADIDAYYAEVLQVEAYFHMLAEDYAYVMTVAEAESATQTQWSRVYDVLAEAHADKVYADRRRRLRVAREAGENEQAGAEAMLRVALGEPTGDPPRLDDVREFVGKESDYGFLEQVWSQLDTGTVTADDWTAVYSIVELAQRVREQMPAPVARQEEWRNLYPSADVTSVSAVSSLESETSYPRWRTFGQPAGEPTADTPPPEAIGWAMSSPLLGLSEGARTIVLTLGFHPDAFDATAITPLLGKKDAPDPFRVQITTAKGLSEPAEVDMVVGDYATLAAVALDGDEAWPALQLTVRLGADADPIAPPPAGTHDVDDVPWPVLVLRLRQVWDADNRRFVAHYTPFRDLVLTAVHLHTKVVGLTGVHIQNDDTALSASKPFHPFGGAPAVGSRFHVGHPELVQTTLDSLAFHIEWMGGPNDLAAHYGNYGLDGEFAARIGLIDKNLEFPLEASAALFTGGDATKPHVIDIPDVRAAIRDTSVLFDYRRSLDVDPRRDLLEWNRYLRWELTPRDFQHSVYDALKSRKGVELAAAMANAAASDPRGTVDADEYQVNPPYTPKVKSLSLDYTASVEIRMPADAPGASGGTSGDDDDGDLLLHLHPFGHSVIDHRSAAPRLLPPYDHEGELYIGIEGTRPPQNLALLFQMAEGSADPDLEPAPIEWSYLSGDRWISLHDGNILSDSTRGLLNSGVVEFQLDPLDASPAACARLPRNLYWIRAAIARHTGSVCDTIAIHTQAVSAVFAPGGSSGQDRATDHYDRPLPAESITGLVVPIPEIASVSQPYTSFGGREAEPDAMFHTRVAERLRHKQRALTVWDHERLVLERFPEIYKVKCLPANLAANPDEPGSVTVIVIPDVREKLPFDPFEPKAPADLLARVEEYLQGKSPAHAIVHARNAHYVPVKVRFGVRFKAGHDEGYYRALLTDELNRFLSPWAYDDGADIVIGGRIYANSIIDFLDRREYVDYIATIKLFSSEDGRTYRLARPSGAGDDGYFVATTRPDSVLVAARQHEIDIISELGYEAASFAGLEYMKIELDFVVG